MKNKWHKAEIAFDHRTFKKGQTVRVRKSGGLWVSDNLNHSSLQSMGFNHAFTDKQVIVFDNVRAIAGIEADPRVHSFTKNYDGVGCHLAEAKDGYLFWGEVGSAIGSVSEICGEINNHLEKDVI